MNRHILFSLLACMSLSLASSGCSKSTNTSTSPQLATASPTPTPTATPDYTPRVPAKQDAADAHFKTVGELATFRWSPPNYTTGFEYDLYYYIPKNVGLHPEKPVKSILFMHGGGESTMTREGSTWAVSLYAKDFMKMADDQNLIVVFPSASGLNWGGHTRMFIRELAEFMRQQLPIDSNSMALLGHSMGGMGITRNAFFLGDQFAFIMPIAAGMDPAFMTEANLLTLFNVPYHHVQGLSDSFDVFVDRARLHEQKMRELEIKMDRPSPFEVTFTNTGHDYVESELSSIVEDQYIRSSRNLYQDDLWGSFTYANRIITDNKIQYNYTSGSDYFWLKAQAFTIPQADQIIRSDFEAHLSDNKIAVTFKGVHNVKTLRVYLSKKMINFSEPVTITVNGVRKVHHLFAPSAKKRALTIQEKNDPGFVFDQYVDINVSDSQKSENK